MIKFNFTQKIFKFFIFFLLVIPNQIFSQTQLGADIDGEAASDLSGYSVSTSSDGTIVAIGAIQNDGTASNAGHVKVYQYSGGTWSQLGADIDGETASDFSGHSVSLSADGTILAIGANHNGGTGGNAGHVRVYQYSGGSWSQLGADIDGEAAGDFSGNSVSLSSDGTKLAVGAAQNDGTASNAGHVRVYSYSGGSWSQLGADIDGEAAGDLFGYSVSLSSDGTKVAIGAVLNDATGLNAGHVRVYSYSGGSWSQLGADIDGEAAGNQSGHSVSLSGDGTIVAIGANANSGAGYASGHVRVYQYSGSSWSQLGNDIDGVNPLDQAGRSVSLSSDGTKLAVGGPGNGGTDNDAGHVRIYEYLFGSWRQFSNEIDGEAAGDSFGYSVSLSSDGTKLAVGAVNNDGSGTSAGHVRVFSLSASFDYTGSAFSQLGSDIDGEATNDVSGFSVSTSGDGTKVAIGAPLNDASGTDAGHVRVYSYSEGSWSQLGADIDGEATGDLFGISVSLSNDGNLVAIGSNQNDGTGTDAGHVRVFEFSGGSWSQLGSDIDAEAAGDRLGESVSLSGDGTKVAIGAPLNDGTGTDGGHVRVYEFSGGSWSQLGVDIDAEAAGDLFGISVSLSNDGSVLAVGGKGNDATGSTAGHVRIYLYSGGSWSQLGSDIDGEAAGDQYGTSVSLSSDGTIVGIGGPLNDATGSNAGHVRVYKYSGGSWSQLGSDIDGEAAGDKYGTSVSLSDDGTTVAIGSNENDGSGSNAGQVRVYKFIGNSWTKLGTDIDGEVALDQSGYSVSLSSSGTKLAIGAGYNDGTASAAGHVKIYNINYSPSDISLSSASVDENVSTGTVVGSLTSSDLNSADSYTYYLVSGAGDTDNASFSISGANLLTNTSIDYETKTSYSIVIRSSDGSGTYSKTISISVNDVDEDIDNDGVINSLDNCVSIANPDQLDTDSDGQGDVCDSDDDNDTYLDIDDAFPLDATEWTDTDSDGTGNNADTDDDNDTYLDTDDAFPLDVTEWIDTDSDGTGNNADTDDDNDTYLDTADAFPLDATEWFDTDSDGTGNNTDSDDDGDNYSDSDEISCGSDPLDSNNLPLDNDLDLSPDCLDLDDDNDTYPDTEDVFPLDSTEWVDFDSDGVGNNADKDDDNDGYADGMDFFQFDSSEWLDFDLDGIGNNADTDDDNDGFSDSDEFSCNTNPLNASSYPLDTDGDSIADCIDEDYNGDGFPDDELIASEVLTPNSTGIESTWKVINIEGFNASVMVYSPSGELVFKSNNYKNDWKGTNKYGDDLPSGPYYYIVNLRGETPVVKKGWLYIFN